MRSSTCECYPDLYGLLRPLDLMQPYRLEMGTKLELIHAWHVISTSSGASIITDKLNQALAEQGDDSSWSTWHRMNTSRR